jgi:hypothetical protein
MTGMHHHIQFFSDEMGGLMNFFYPGWPRTMILPISASQVARITYVSHLALSITFDENNEVKICVGFLMN